jgi:hypothetical protein
MAGTHKLTRTRQPGYPGADNNYLHYKFLSAAPKALRSSIPEPLRLSLPVARGPSYTNKHHKKSPGMEWKAEAQLLPDEPLPKDNRGSIEKTHRHASSIITSKEHR